MVPKDARKAWLPGISGSTNVPDTSHAQEKGFVPLRDLVAALSEHASQYKNVSRAHSCCAFPAGTMIVGDLGRTQEILFGILDSVISCGGGAPVRLSIALEDRMAALIFATEQGQVSAACPGFQRAQAILHLVGGEITRASSRRDGLRMKVRLPIASNEPECQETKAALTSPAEPVQYFVLVAEDHPFNLKLILALLQASGCSARCAQDGREALAMLEERDFDLIVMDSQMPLLTGLEAIANIRRRNDWKACIPILSLTANAMRGAEEVHTSAGADLYMSKPFRSDCFIGAVKSLAGRGRDLRNNRQA
ncbi:MAG: response regulator [Rhodomicrobium sp.]